MRRMDALYRYGVAVLGVSVALLIKFAVEPCFGPVPPALLFTAAVAVAAWYGGLGPGLLALGLGAIAADYYYVPPVGVLFVFGPGELFFLIGFILEAGFIIWVVVRLRSALQVARDRQMALHESEERLRLAVHASHVGLWDWDLRTNAVIYSPEWKAQLGHSEDEVQNTFDEWEKRVHPEDREIILDRARHAMAGPDYAFEGEFRMRHKDGSWRWIFTRAEAVRDAVGDTVRILGCHVDITDRKRAETDLRDRESRLRTILDTAADGIVTIDATGTILTMNRATDAMFGYEGRELVGQNIDLLMPTLRTWQDMCLTRYRLTGDTRVIGSGREAVARHKDGSSFPVELTLSEVDQLRQFTVVIRNITRRKQLEREVVEIASMEQRRIGQDLHDTVGQELTALSIMASDLADAVQADPTAAARLAGRVAEGLRRSQQELRVVIRGLLPVPVDAEGLMSALADLADRTQMDARVVCRFDCPELVAVADNLTATHLYLIAQEAVHNAVWHGRPRTVRILLHILPDDRRLVLRVEDDGCGMPKGSLTSGRGLGLRIMHDRAAIIGARLTIEPMSPTGTCVVCELPGEFHGQE